MILEFQFTFYLHSNFEYHHMVKNDAFTPVTSTDSNQVPSLAGDLLEMLTTTTKFKHRILKGMVH